MKISIYFLAYLTQFFLEWEMFQTEVVEKVKTCILYSVTFSWKLCRVWDNVEKYCRAGQATNDMLDTWGYRHPLEYIILLFHCNNGCTNVPQCYIHVHCLSYVNVKKVCWCKKKLIYSVFLTSVNWCQHWFEYFPFPPVNVLSMIENVLSEHDSALLAFYYDAGIKTDLYAWTLLEMAFSEVCNLI